MQNQTSKYCCCDFIFLSLGQLNYANLCRNWKGRLQNLPFRNPSTIIYLYKLQQSFILAEWIKIIIACVSWKFSANLWRRQWHSPKLKARMWPHWGHVTVVLGLGLLSLRDCCFWFRLYSPCSSKSRMSFLQAMWCVASKTGNATQSTVYLQTVFEPL